MTKVLVTDGNNRAALAITRSLGRAGYHVIVGAEHHPSLSSISRFCGETFLYPDPRRDSQGFVHALLNVTKEKRPDVLIPVSDTTTLLVTENRGLLADYCSIPFPEFDAVEQAANKFTLMALAEKLGVPVPKTVCLERPDDLEAAVSSCKKMGYPIVIKPSRSRIRSVTGWIGTGVQYANGEAELRNIIYSTRGMGEYPLLLQERVIGEGAGVFLCFNRGEVVAEFNHRRLREKPPSGGVSVLRESIPMDPLLKLYSERLLRTLKWHGVAMVEFKRDKRTEEFKLMEINGRFWGSLQLAIDSGVDFPSLLVRIAKGEKVDPVAAYKVGIRSRWFWGDVDVLLNRMFKNNKTLNLPPHSPGRLRTLLSFLQFWGKDLHYEVLDRGDIKPWLYETKRWFRGRDNARI
jgi:predicted ATP-grasp superfamily ATP-dependent carboligase